MSESTEVTSVSVLVSTRSVYANGIKAKEVVTLGDVAKRFELTDYDDKDEFMVAVDDYVVNVLKDTNPDRELYFFEPQINLVADNRSKDSVCGLISESDIDEDLWELMSLDKESMAIFFAWFKLHGMSGSIVGLTLLTAKEHFVGYFDGDDTFGKNLVESSGDLEGIPEYISNNIDYEGIGQEALNGGLNSSHSEDDGYYFTSY